MAVYFVIETKSGGRRPFYGETRETARRAACAYAETVDDVILRCEERASEGNPDDRLIQRWSATDLCSDIWSRDP